MTNSFAGPNLAVHKYVGVDWAVVWKIAQDEVPLLEERCR
jgi:uncharacterized protein with HEPN domain